jgi:2-polyprenyl-3-methyl-5-hydroxy-6-metoxy-1,4-benzoquinol methylase
MKCYLCKSQNIRFYLIKDGFNYYKCLNCNLIQQIPLPKINIIKKIYDNNDSYFVNEEDDINLNLSKTSKESFFYSIMEPFLKDTNIRILDVGAATGLMLAHLKLNNFLNLEGVEISKWACEVAKKRFNINLKNSDIFNVDYPPNTFDLVISNHVIEHLRDPFYNFQKINQFLKKGGLLFISTPNASCLNSRLVRRYWKFFSPNEHIFLFDNVSIRFFLNQLGFEVIEIKNWLFNRRNLLIYLIQLIYPIVRDILRKIRGKKAPLDNFMTSKDGMILIAKKVKDVN